MSMARTNIDIDEEACRRVMERFNLTTMKDAVNLALRTLAIEPMTLEGLTQCGERAGKATSLQCAPHVPDVVDRYISVD